MRVAVYSGSFNPIHEGHLSILRGLKGFDATYMLVTPSSPFKDDAANSLERLEAARRVLAANPDISARLDDIEYRMDGPWYTIRTLRALKAREPHNDFTLVIGGDNLAAIRQWRDYQSILLEFGVLVFPRQGADSQALKADLLAENPHYRIALADAPLVNISSSMIRAGIKKN